jgi:hypothetical protein
VSEKKIGRAIEMNEEGMGTIVFWRQNPALANAKRTDSICRLERREKGIKTKN